VPSPCTPWLFFYCLVYRESHRETQRIMNRKEFFKTTGRLLILSGITASAGYLFLNKKVSASCSVSPTCKNCGKVSNCENPEVKEARDGEKK
jgi:hypothetical protein